MLYDTIINFGEHLPEKELNQSFEEATQADLCLVLGSSLTVTPAADIPKKAAKKGKLVIINLQRTPLDYSAHLVINGTCEDVMMRLAKKIELKVQDFLLKRLISFRLDKVRREYIFRGINEKGVPFSFFYSVHMADDGPRDQYRQ